MVSSLTAQLVQSSDMKILDRMEASGLNKNRMSFGIINVCSTVKPKENTLQSNADGVFDHKM